MDAARRPDTMLAFLFTDIAGSTALWEAFPEAMEHAYQRHDAILRSVTAAHGGVVYKVVGDAFQIAFPTPGQALAAAVTAQQALVTETWPLPHPLWVRMALHAGPIAADARGDYRSPVLNRLGRLLSAGHGGQILLTDAMSDAVRDDLPTGACLRDLGRHRLRDLPEPEPIAQVLAAGLPEQFPPLQTLDPQLVRLPAPATPIIGRATEIEQIAGLLRERESRLVTLTGAGGTGKTRLALEVAHRLRDDWADGVVFVDLAPVTNPALLLPAIAEAIGLRASGDRSSAETLTAYLADREFLVLLDNFEQIIEAAPAVSELLAHCANLSLMVTSREALRIRAERIVPVDPLAVPEERSANSLDDVARVASVTLFLERAGTAMPGFAMTTATAPVIAAICRQVEGLPLAIELAAARVRMLSPAALLARLSGRLDLLSDGARDLPRRHQTLRATIAWSYDLLTPDEQELFRSLAVFAGGFTLDAAEGIVCGSASVLPRLTSLVDKHLLRRIERDDEPRFTMMETVRAYALEALAQCDEESEARRRHATWFHQWAISTPDLAEDRGLDWLEAEHGNLRTALEWTRETGDAVKNLELAGALARFWHLRGYLSEGRSFLESALESTGGTLTPARLTALMEAGTLANANGDYRRALVWLEQARAAAMALDDQASIAAVLNSIAGARLELGEIDQAEALFTESMSIARRLGDRRRYAAALGNLGAVAHYRGNIEMARNHYQEALTIRRELGDTFGIATMLVNLLTLLAPFPEHLDEAIAFGDEGLRCSTELGDRLGEGYALAGLGLIAEVQEDFSRAAAYHAQSLTRFQEAEDRSGIARAQGNLGMMMLALGDPEEAARLCRESLSAFVELDEQDSIATLLDCLAAIAAADQRAETAAHLLGAAEALREEIGVAIPIESQARREQTVTTIHHALDQRAFEASRHEGRVSPLEESVRLALEYSGRRQGTGERTHFTKTGFGIRSDDATREAG